MGVNEGHGEMVIEIIEIIVDKLPGCMCWLKMIATCGDTCITICFQTGSKQFVSMIDDNLLWQHMIDWNQEKNYSVNQLFEVWKSITDNGYKQGADIESE